MGHDHLAAKARKFGFNLWVFRWLLSLYRSPRRIVVAGVASVEVRTCTTIVPGDCFADVLMRLALIDSLDTLVIEFSVMRMRDVEVHVGALADDVQILVIGGSETASVAANASCRLFQLLEGGDEVDLESSSLDERHAQMAELICVRPPAAESKIMSISPSGRAKNIFLAI